MLVRRDVLQLIYVHSQVLFRPLTFRKNRVSALNRVTVGEHVCRRITDLFFLPCLKYRRNLRLNKSNACFDTALLCEPRLRAVETWPHDAAFRLLSWRFVRGSIRVPTPLTTSYRLHIKRTRFSWDRKRFEKQSLSWCNIIEICWC